MRNRIDNGKVGPKQFYDIYLIMFYLLIGLFVAMSLRLYNYQGLIGTLTWPIILGG